MATGDLAARIGAVLAKSSRALPYPDEKADQRIGRAAPWVKPY